MLVMQKCQWGQKATIKSAFSSQRTKKKKEDVNPERQKAVRQYQSTLITLEKENVIPCHCPCQQRLSEEPTLLAQL